MESCGGIPSFLKINEHRLRFLRFSIGILYNAKCRFPGGPVCTTLLPTVVSWDLSNAQTHSRTLPKPSRVDMRGGDYPNPMDSLCSRLSSMPLKANKRDPDGHRTAGPCFGPLRRSYSCNSRKIPVPKPNCNCSCAEPVSEPVRIAIYQLNLL